MKEPILIILILIGYISFICIMYAARIIIRMIDKSLSLRGKNIKIEKSLANIFSKGFLIIVAISFIISLIYRCACPQYSKEYWRDADNYDYMENHIP